MLSCNDADAATDILKDVTKVLDFPDDKRFLQVKWYHGSSEGHSLLSLLYWFIRIEECCLIVNMTTIHNRTKNVDIHGIVVSNFF